VLEFEPMTYGSEIECATRYTTAPHSAPKLLHTMQGAPCSRHAALRKFDELLGDSVSTIINTDLTDVQWIQASLPVRHSGLGI